MADNTWAGLNSAINVPELTEKIRIEAQDVQGLAQLASPGQGTALGKNRGDTGQYTYVPDMSPEYGSALSETEPMPTSGVDPIKAQFTVSEYGHGISYTGYLDALTRLDMDDVHMQSLNNHRKRLENVLVYNQLSATDWKYVFDSSDPDNNEFVTNGTATKNSSIGHLTLANLSRLRVKAKTQKIPFFDGESYVYATGAEELEELESDSSLTNLLKEDSGRAALNGELGRIKGCRLVEDNYSITDHAQGFEEGFLIGADAVIEEWALPWEMRFEISDVGRSKVLAYYGIKAVFKVLDQTTHSMEHIIHVTAAA